MNKIFRFLYLNTYSFLLLFGGIILILISFLGIPKLLTIPSIIISFFFFYNSVKLFSSWNDKKVKCEILYKKNINEFRPDTFKVFMQAPCGRLVTKVVLKDLNQKEKYKELLIYKEPFLASIKNNFKPTKTSIYINKDFLWYF